MVIDSGKRVEAEKKQTATERTTVPESIWKEEKKKGGKIILWIGIALAIVLVGGLFFWLGGRGEGISSVERKQNEERIKGLIGEEEWQRVKKEGPGLADKLLKEQPTVPVAPAELPAGFKTGSWTETFQTKYGPLKVSYTVSSALKDKIKSRPVLEDDQFVIYLYSSESVNSTAFLVWKDKNGQIIGTNNPKRDFYPDLKERDVSVSVKGVATFEVKVGTN